MPPRGETHPLGERARRPPRAPLPSPPCRERCLPGRRWAQGCRRRRRWVVVGMIRAACGGRRPACGRPRLLPSHGPSVRAATTRVWAAPACGPAAGCRREVRQAGARLTVMAPSGRASRWPNSPGLASHRGALRRATRASQSTSGSRCGWPSRSTAKTARELVGGGDDGAPAAAADGERLAVGVEPAAHGARGAVGAADEHGAQVLGAGLGAGVPALAGAAGADAGPGGEARGVPKVTAGPRREWRRPRRGRCRGRSRAGGAARRARPDRRRCAAAGRQGAGPARRARRAGRPGRGGRSRAGASTGHRRADRASATRTVAFRQRFLPQPRPSCHPVGIRPACAVRSPTGC